MLYTQKMNHHPVFIDETGEITKLKRTPFMSGDFNELWLQEVIAKHPSLLPSSEISSDFAPLVCIGREVPVGEKTSHGFIDNLYISPKGHVVIVETKLFRNQESRREVVAQIIDYAKDVQKWDSRKLNQIASDYFFKTEGQALSLIDVMARHGFLSYSDESKFIDSINNHLKRAEILLIIVGDGIRSNVEDLAVFLNENSSLHFNLALVELEIYPHNNGTIIVPNLMTKTSVVERQVVNGYSMGLATYSSAAFKEKPFERKPVLSRKEFISVFSDNGGYDPDEVMGFILDIESIDGISISISPTELAVKFAVNEDFHTLLTFSISANHSDIWVVPGRIKSFLSEHKIQESQADDFLDFYKNFVNTKRCKTKPYEHESGFYYANVCEVINNQESFITAVEQFIYAVTKK